MSNFDKMPNQHSKRGIVVYALRRHVEQGTGPTFEAIRDEIFGTGRFRDPREVEEYMHWALRHEWIRGGLDALAQQAAPAALGPISVRDPEVGRLARQLAAMRRTNITEAIKFALRTALRE